MMNTHIKRASMTCVQHGRGMPARLALVLALTTALAACVVGPPPGLVLSRLPSDAPGAATPARPLSSAEKKRYDEIDKQVLNDQDAAIAADNWARYYAPYYTPYYYPAPTVYGGYVGGGGFGYYSPGFYPGWGW